jgi:glutathione S-transferase
MTGRKMPTYTATVTLASIALYFAFALRVAIARRKFDVPLPATSGQPDFERIFRVHQNTLEWLPTYLAPLWICAFFLNDAIAAGLGLVWVVGRVLYAVGYGRAVQGRLPGFFVQSSACILLFVAAATGVAMHFLQR